jgi:hypothetical protein
MRKIYFEPEMELVKFQTAGFLAISTGTGAEGGDDDGGSDVNPTDPDTPGWGDDY